MPIRVQRYAGDIHESGQHLLTLIDEILDISRIEERGATNSTRRPSRSRNRRGMPSPHARTRGKQGPQDRAGLRGQPAPGLGGRTRLAADLPQSPVQRHQVHTAEGTVTLKVAQTANGSLSASVKDTGPGIPDDEIPRVLRSFGQGSLAHQTAEGGTGLGLPITKGLIELHHGKFELKSKLRYGTEVTVSLPPSRVMQALPRIAEPGEPLPEEAEQSEPRKRAS